jgi:hypothetical protein
MRKAATWCCCSARATICHVLFSKVPLPGLNDRDCATIVIPQSHPFLLGITGPSQGTLPRTGNSSLP